MKPLLAAVAGFVVALGLFAGGIAVATGVIMVDEAPPLRAVGDVAEVWTVQPRPVDVEAQDFERVGPAVTTGASRVEVTSSQAAGAETIVASADPGLDTMTTAAFSPRAAEHGDMDEVMAELQAAHVAWCSRRYRSYDPASDSYRPYRGGSERCESPYSGEMGSMEEPAMHSYASDVPAQPAGYGGDRYAGASALSPDHVRNCFSRYRSYRVEDNTYQPFGGGPRRLCE